MNIFNDVTVQIFNETNVHSMSFVEAMMPLIENEVRWSMRVTSNDMVANISLKAAPYIHKSVVVSCLLSGLKHIEDHWIYHSACREVENQLGLSSVDISVRKEISRIEFREGNQFDIEIMPVIGHDKIEVPVIHAELHNGLVYLHMRVKVDSFKAESKVAFSQELWSEAGSQCIADGQIQLIESLHESFPELTHNWCILKYHFFGKQKSVEIGTSSKFGDGPDRRVSQLPGLEEKVKNPETDSIQLLRYAIISLNDTYKWTREAIADWLETLDVDITFKVKNE